MDGVVLCHLKYYRQNVAIQTHAGKYITYMCTLGPAWSWSLGPDSSSVRAWKMNK